MKPALSVMLVLSAVMLAAGYPTAASSAGREVAASDDLAGAWRARVQFRTGALSSVKDLEFMYAFNAGGTMTESSNYDASPPVPPAYGVWRKIQPRQYQAKYVFFLSRAPTSFDDIANGGGWSPGGSGVLVETITLAEDGRTYTSVIRLDLFDAAGRLTESNSQADSTAARISF
jgi:hypothetical protein